VAKVVRVSYRAKREHPYLIWKTLISLRVMDKLQGKPERFYETDDIANVLYSNWPELNEHEREVVRFTKLRFSLSFLSGRSYILEEIERVKLRKYTVYDLDHYEDRHLGRWKARESIFSSIYDTREAAEEATREVMDSFWGLWINRKGAVYG
jgi:hypothetical protein